MKNTFLCVLITCIAILTTSCSEYEKSHDENSVGLSTSTSTISGAEVYDAILTSLNENENISIIAQVNHTENALSSEMTLPYTRVVIFGNPKLGTPLMNKNILAGLDLPQKILVTENEDGTVEVSFNSTTYLMERYDLGIDETLMKIENALSTIVESTTGILPHVKNSTSTDKEEGIKVYASSSEFETTYAGIKSKIENNQNLEIISEIDHSLNASSVNLSLPNSKLILFGNPKLGTPLMLESQLIGIDLPQKILVYEEDNKVNVAYNDIDYLIERHNVEVVEEIGDKIEAVLESIVEDNI